MIVFNATPLIYLTKIQKLDYIIELYDTILISQKVHDEVVKRGKKLQKIEVSKVEQFIEEKKIQIKKVAIKTSSFPSNLHPGEVETIQLAMNLPSKILIDDRPAYNYCKLLNLDVIRTVGILVELFLQNRINKVKLKENIIKLTIEGFWITSDILARIEEFLDDF
ncbi:MAG: hypothetical protein ACTSQI_16005 [Candidatus Helarchaeota archaeon]